MMGRLSLPETRNRSVKTEEDTLSEPQCRVREGRVADRLMSDGILGGGWPIEFWHGHMSQVDAGAAPFESGL